MTPEQATRRNYERMPYPGNDPAVLKRIADHLPPRAWLEGLGRSGLPPARRILVAGCGTGLEAFSLRRQWPEADLVAVDFSPRSIAEAKRFQRTAGFDRPIRFLVADLTDPDLAGKIGGNFDLISCHGVLSYIPDPGRVLRHLAGCLADSGALYLGVNGETHPATRLRPWLENFGLGVGRFRDERRLRELLHLWDSLQETGMTPLARMIPSYLASDVCGPHFNNWSLARWRKEAGVAGWRLVATTSLPSLLRHTLEEERYSPLFPACFGELAERLDEARPASFHGFLLRKSPAGVEQSAFALPSGGKLHWTGLYSARFVAARIGQPPSVVLSAPLFNLRLDWPLTAEEIAVVRELVECGAISTKRILGRSGAARRRLWLWAGFGVVAIGA